MEPMKPMKAMEPMKPMAPMKPQQAWWPEGLGTPASTGSQDDLKYAYFADARRLAVQSGGRTTVYDTADHQIGGVSQQRQGKDGRATFTSQHGDVSLDQLKIVS
jgi:nitrous oxide reductase accessory protein NosL